MIWKGCDLGVRLILLQLKEFHCLTLEPEIDLDLCVPPVGCTANSYCQSWANASNTCVCRFRALLVVGLTGTNTAECQGCVSCCADRTQSLPEAHVWLWWFQKLDLCADASWCMDSIEVHLGCWILQYVLDCESFFTDWAFKKPC